MKLSIALMGDGRWHIHRTDCQDMQKIQKQRHASTIDEFDGTVEEAIADGQLVDGNAGDLDEVSRQHFPNARAAMTSTLFGLIEKAVAHPRWLNDYRGVWHDVCFMSRFRNADGLFKVIITGTGRVRNHILRRVESHDADGTPTVTFMLRGED